jgi:antitoxin component YwqK of YwqJK toxin-antitoxin module
LDDQNETINNKDYIFSAIYRAMKKNICEKFNPLELAKKFNLPIEDLEIDYWYDIIVKRAELDTAHSYKKETPINDKLSQNIEGHYDTYAIKFNKDDNTVGDIFDQMSVRVITFAHVYQNLKTHSEETFDESFKDYLNREGINLEEFMNSINLMIMHAKASLYSAIAYAMNHTISKNDIINWYPRFEEDRKSLKPFAPDCVKIIFDDSKKKEYNPKETYHDKISNEVYDKDGIWTIEIIEKEMAFILNEMPERDGLEFLKTNEIDVNNVPGNEYFFIRNLVFILFDLISEDPNWTFKNNAQNRLYDLRYNSKNLKNISHSEYSLFLESAILELHNVDLFLSKKLNDYDSLNKENNFQGYEKLDQILTISRQVKNYLKDLKKDILIKEEGDDSIISINQDDMEDVGDITHYEGKPFNGIGFILHENGELKLDCTFKDGLKHGGGSLFNDDGSIIKYQYYQDEVLRYDLDFENDCDNILTEDRVITRYFNEGGYLTFGLKEDYEDDTPHKFLIDEIMSDNFNENSENYNLLIQSNYSFMEAGLKYYLNNDSNEVWVPGMIPEKKDDKIYYQDKLYSGVLYNLFNNGKLNELSTFRNGELNGISKKFNKEGKLEEINYWIDGQHYSGL